MIPSPTFIFDVGGVLIRHDNELLFDRLAARCTDPVTARPLIASGLHDEDVNTGRLSVDALHAAFAAELGYAADYTTFLATWNSHFSEEPGMEAVMRALATRHRVVLFSNTNAAHWAYVTAAYPALGHAQAEYVSYKLGLAKPDPASFREVVGRENARAENCIFIDDREDNTTAAAALGMRIVTFAGAERFRATLAEWGIPIGPSGADTKVKLPGS
jgi:HAD superfamily hydrolase (TIGR01509 family)